MLPGSGRKSRMTYPVNTKKVRDYFKCNPNHSDHTERVSGNGPLHDTTKYVSKRGSNHGHILAALFINDAHNADIVRVLDWIQSFLERNKKMFFVGYSVHKRPTVSLMLRRISRDCRFLTQLEILETELSPEKHHFIPEEESGVAIGDSYNTDCHNSVSKSCVYFIRLDWSYSNGGTSLC